MQLLRFALCLLATLALLCSAACESDGGGSDVGTVGQPDVQTHDVQMPDAPAEDVPAVEDAVEDAVDEPDAAQPSVWEQVDWQPIVAEGDALEDCTGDDADCLADLVAMSYAVAGEELFVRVSFAEDFPMDVGSFEIFLFAADPGLTGLTVRHVPGAMRYWWAECDDAGTQKHSGCHWTVQQAPASLRHEWIDARRFGVRVRLADAGLPEATAARFGVAAAPFDVNVTAQFSDRLPDALLVTATEVQGLASVTW